MSRFNKIKLIFISAIISIFLTLIISIIVPTIIFTMVQIDEVLEVFLCLLMFIVLLLLLGALTYFGFSKLIKKYKDKNRICCISIKLNPSQLQTLKTSDGALTYYKNTYHLKTISFYKTESFDLSDWKSQRKKHNRMIKKMVKTARNDNPKLRHWIYQINVFEHDNTNTEEVKSLISKLNSDRLYEIGKINFAYCPSNSLLILKSFEADGLNLTGFYRFIRLNKFFCKTFNIDYRYFRKCL